MKRFFCDSAVNNFIKFIADVMQESFLESSKKNGDKALSISILKYPTLLIDLELKFTCILFPICK